MKRTWIKGLTMGRFPGARGEPGYYFVDDRNGQRRAATSFEVALWRRAVGAVPIGPNGPLRVKK